MHGQTPQAVQALTEAVDGGLDKSGSGVGVVEGSSHVAPQDFGAVVDHELERVVPGLGGVQTEAEALEHGRALEELHQTGIGAGVRAARQVVEIALELPLKLWDLVEELGHEGPNSQGEEERTKGVALANPGRRLHCSRALVGADDEG